MLVKKFIWILFLILVPINLYSQNSYPINRKSIRLDGNASFNSIGGDSYGDDRSNSISIGSGVLYFIMPKFAIGGICDIYCVDNVGVSLGIGPSINYYLCNLDSKMYPFLGISILFGHGNDDILGCTYTENRFLFTGGFDIMIFKNAALSLKFFHQIERRKFRDVIFVNNKFGTEIGFSLFFL